MNSFELLQAYFKKETFEFEGDPKEAIARENKQSLAPYLYYVYGDRFLNVYLGATLIQEKFYSLQKELTSLFNANSIDHFYIKGSVLSRIYPDSTLRTRGDIDVLVRESDYKRAAKILEENDYHFEGECNHHKGFMKNNLEVELHRTVCDDNDSFSSYFKDIFNHATKVSDSLYELEPSIHYIYLIYHLNRHLKSGEGLRSFIDFYYMDSKYNLDYDFIEGELEKLGFTKLYHSICAAIYAITGKKLRGYEDIDIMPLINSLLETGVHGINTGFELIDKRDIKKSGSKLKYLLNKLFMDKDTRRVLYPRLSKIYILYPVMWCHRLFILLFKRKGRLKQLMRIDKEAIDETLNVYNKYGVID